MKKNLLSIIILSLLVVNIVLTVVMMLSVIKTNSATAELVTDIAGVLQLELGGEEGGEMNVSLADTEVYTIPDSMTITLKRDDGDTSDHYCIVNVALSMDMTNEDYETYKDSVASMEGIIKSEIFAVVGGYTLAEAQISQQQMCDEILERLQELFDSKFIYKVSFSSIMFG